MFRLVQQDATVGHSGAGSIVTSGIYAYPSEQCLEQGIVYREISCFFAIVDCLPATLTIKNAISILQRANLVVYKILKIIKSMSFRIVKVFYSP